MEPLRQTVSCVTGAYLLASGGGKEVGKVHALTLAGAEPIILTDAGTGATLSIAMQYDVIDTGNTGSERYKIRTRAYDYAFRDFSDREIVSYHWHPLREDGFLAPHIHASGTKPHLPSGGRISLESVVRAAITEFGAEPMRPDWEQVLLVNESKFRLYRTWHNEVQLAEHVPAARTAPMSGAKVTGAKS